MILFSADCDALHFRLDLCRLLHAGVRPEKGIQVDHLHDAHLRQHLAQGHLPAPQRRLLRLPLRHARDRYGKVGPLMTSLGPFVVIIGFVL